MIVMIVAIIIFFLFFIIFFQFSQPHDNQHNSYFYNKNYSTKNRL